MGVELERESQTSSGEDEGRVELRCAVCDHLLAKQARRVYPEGSHRHGKVNPYGKVFELACFHPVTGCLGLGKPSAEFSWFEGCYWQMTVCGACQLHLGWDFSGADQFSALIVGAYEVRSGESN